MTDADQLWTRRDRWIAMCILFAATLGGVETTRAYVAGGNAALFYQSEFGPAVLAACGRGFRNPPDSVTFPELSTLEAFLQQTTQSLDCASLPHTIASTPLNAFQIESPYLLRLAGWMWMLAGVSWPTLAWLGGMLMGISAAAVYLFFRGAMGIILSVFLTALWATGPLHLLHVPHLRDYSKAPFFAVMLAAIMWAVRSTTAPVVTVITMAILGAFFGLGFGFRTDVSIYLPVVVVALLFRPPWSGREAATKCVASITAVVMFLIFAAPVLRNYQGGNNFAHWALLGLTDPSRDRLQLQQPPYSFGYLYNDGYVAAIVSAEAERHERRELPVALRSSDYAYWGNQYYARLLRTFPGDMLTRFWAAVKEVLRLPFIPIQVQRPSWSTGIAGRVFDWRGSVVQRVASVPPVAILVVALALLGAVNLRLAILAGGLCAFLAGFTAIQFQDRHIFQLEVLSWCAIGFLVTTLSQMARGRLPLADYPQLLKRAALVVVVIALSVVAPLTVARWYQSRHVEQLFATFEAAPTDQVEVRPTAASLDQMVLNQVVRPPQWHADRFTSSDMMVAAFGGEQCDADAVDVTFRYHSKEPYPDFTRHRQVPMPAAGPQRTRILFPVYATGGRTPDPSGLAFAGIELREADQPCLIDVRRVTRPEALPVFMEAVLAPDWRSQRLYEAFQGIEPASDRWRVSTHSVPIGLQTGRRWLSSIEPHIQPPRSSQRRSGTLK